MTGTPALPAPDAVRLRWALDALRRLADPEQFVGFGDAESPHNQIPELRAMRAYAEREHEAVRTGTRQ